MIDPLWRCNKQRLTAPDLEKTATCFRYSRGSACLQPVRGQNLAVTIRTYSLTGACASV